MAALAKETLQDDLKEALKGGDRVRVSTLRLLLSQIKNREIDKGGALDEAELMAAVNAGIKQRRESIEGAEKAGRAELAAQERAEMAILQAYLPPALDDAALAALVDEAIRETGASAAKDMGAVMKWLMPRVAGKADGKIVNQKVREKLS